MSSPESAPIESEYLTAEEAAAIARVSTRTVYDAIRFGELRAGGLRSRYRIKREWIEEWIERRGQAE